MLFNPNSRDDKRGMERGSDRGSTSRSEGKHQHQRQTPFGERVRPKSGGASHSTMADTSGARTTSRGAKQNARQQRVATKPFNDSGSIFPPAPNDGLGWGSVLYAAPDFAPTVARRDLIQTAKRNWQAILSTDPEGQKSLQDAIQKRDGLQSLEDQARQLLEGEKTASEFRRLVDGLANRSRPLRLLGNGVCPLAASHAFRTLSAAHGLGRVDLEAAGESIAAGSIGDV